MGFRLDRTYVLEFEGDLEGAVVKIRATPAGVAQELREMNTSPGVCALLAEWVEEWNLEDRDGTPIKLEAGAILAGVEEPVLVVIAREWLKAAVGVTAPLDVRSMSIGREVEESLEMTLPESSPMPSAS